MLIIQLVIADDTATVTIDVNVTETESITVAPTYINWTLVATGSAAGYRNLTVKNAGSLNVSDIYAYVDTLDDETSRPYGSGDPSDFAAGGVLTLRNETTTSGGLNSGYYFAGRIEWNWTQDIPTHDWSNVDSPVAWGYFRNTSNDYVWVLGNGTAPDGISIYCNDTGSQFSIETDVDLGTLPTRTPDNTFAIKASTNDGDTWGFTNITSGPLSGHCLAAYYDCTFIYIYKFDQRSN